MVQVSRVKSFPSNLCARGWPRKAQRGHNVHGLNQAEQLVLLHSTEAGKIDPSGARSSQPRNGLIAAASMKTAAAPASGRGMVAWEVS